MSIYKRQNLNIISYKYFSNNIFGSMLGMLSIFYIAIYFGTSNMISIEQQLLTINLIENVEILLVFMLFIFSLIIDFFILNTSKYYDTKISKTMSFISISNIFVNFLIGIYLFLEITYMIFSSEVLLDNFYVENAVFLASSILIIYNSIKCVTKKNNTLYNMFLRFNLISFSNIILSIFLRGDNMMFSTMLLFLYLFEFVSINLSLYIFSSIVSIIYGDNSISVINNNKLFKNILLFIILFKICIPFGTSLYINIYFIDYVITSKDYLYLIPFCINKLCHIMLFINVFRDKSQVETTLYSGTTSKKYLYKLYFSVFMIFCLVMLFEIFFRKYIMAYL
jgi:hypothetical protein